MKNLAGQAIEINKYTVLTEKELNALKRAALSPEVHGNVKELKLTPKQKKIFLQYMIEEAEKYPSGHSMRFTILRDAVKATVL